MAKGAGPTLLQERYELLALVGRGGQGEVWRAHDHRHGRTVAIKMRRCAEADRSDVLAEGGVLLSLRPHPNVPTVREDFFAGDDYCLVMDWIEGMDLRRLVTGQRGLPLGTVVHYL